MNLEEYTPANICAAMGLGSFAFRPWRSAWTVRILLKPSFCPEVCVSISAKKSGRATAVVTALVKSFWIMPRVTGRRLAVFSDSCRLDGALATRARDCIVHPGTSLKLNTCDGMGYDSVVDGPLGVFTRSGHVSTDNDIRKLFLDLLPALYESLTEENCVHALMQATKAVPREPLKEFDVFRMVVLGEQDSSPPREQPPPPIKLFAVFEQLVTCPRCSRTALRFRKLPDRLVCHHCGRSFELDRCLLSTARTEPEGLPGQA